MKKLFLIFVLYYTLFLTHFTMSQWMQVPSGMGTNQIVNAFFESGNNIFAGTYNGLYISTNSGSTWSMTGINNKAVLSFALNGNTIFAGTNTSGVLLSTNSGINWSQTSLNNQFVYSLAANGNNVFAGTNNNGVYLSTNNGLAWTQTSLNNKEIRSIVINGNNIFAGGYGTGVYISTNNGTNWAQTNMTKPVYALAFNGNTLFAGVFDLYNVSQRGVYYTTNNGYSWGMTSLSEKSIRSFALSGNHILAGTEENGVFHTTNNGSIWYSRNQGFGNLNTVSALLITNNYAFAGTFGYSIWRSPVSVVLKTENAVLEILSEYRLYQNYPNPFNPVTHIDFDIPKTEFVSIKIFDILGREVRTLVNKEKPAGSYSVDFNAADLTSGIYFYKLEADRYSEVKRMVLIK